MGNQQDVNIPEPRGRMLPPTRMQGSFTRSTTVALAMGSSILSQMRCLCVAVILVATLPLVSAQNLARVQQLNATIKQQLASGDTAGLVESMTEMADQFAELAGPNHPQVLETRLLLVPQLIALGRNDDALITAKQTLARIESVTPVDQRLQAVAKDRIGMVHQATGRDARAMTAHQAAMDHLSSIGQAGSLAWADAATNLAQILGRKNELVSASKLSESALTIYQRLAGNRSPKTATALNNLGLLQVNLGQKDQAEKNLVSALDIYHELYGNDHPELASSHSSLAMLYAGRPGKTQLAGQHYRSAMAMATKHFGDDHPTTATVKSNYGVWWLDQGNLDEAEPLFRDSLRYREKELGRDDSSTATVMHNLGTLLVARRKWDEALPLLKESAATLARQGGISIAMAADGHAFQAWAATLNGDLDQAITEFDQARTLATDFVWNTLPDLDTNQQQKLLAKPFVSTLHNALTLADRHPESPEVLGATATWLANGKGIAEEALMRNLRGESEGQADKPFEPVTLNQVSEAIPDGAAYVDIIRQDIFNYEAIRYDDLLAEPHYVAWIVTPSGEVQHVDLGEAEPIDELVEVLRTEIAGAADLLKEKGEIEAVARWANAAQPITDAVWSPVQSRLPVGTTEVILSPDGNLWLVPWAALPMKKPIPTEQSPNEQATKNQASDRFLIEDYIVSTVISGRAMVRRTNDRGISSVAPAIFSNPNFDQTAQEKRDSFIGIFRRSPPARSPSDRSLSLNKHRLDAGSLPGTAVESAAIAPSLAKWNGGKQPITYQGRYALESVAKDLRSPRTVVFATHGFFWETDAANVDSQSVNPLDRCGLLLAGCNDPGSVVGDDDGVLFGSEIANINLQTTELVVLSACETGLGKIEAGNGVAGLRRAFHLAGAKHVASTLWRIPDFDTAKLMSEFFSALAQNTAATETARRNEMAGSLQMAQTRRIQSRRDRHGAAHPYFWAGFLLSGPPR